MLLTFIAVSACKDDKKQTQSACELNPENCQSVLESKNFFVFNYGSYWIYQEATTLQKDSMYVTDYSNDLDGFDFDVYIFSSLSGFTYHYFPTFYGNLSGCSLNGPVSKRCLFVNRTKFKYQEHLGQAVVFFFNYHIGESISTGADLDYCPNNQLTYAAKFDSLEINNIYYKDVIRIDQDCEFAEGKQPTRTFYARNVGIIRKELIDSNQVWNLVNYHVVK